MTSCMNKAWTYVMKPFGTDGIGLALNLHTRSKSARQEECSPVIGNVTSVRGPML